MSSLDPASNSASLPRRAPKTLLKLERLNKALRHQEPDWVPISDFFWGSFVELRRQFGPCIAFCGSSDVRVWESGDREAVRKEALRKLNAAKGGGHIVQCDPSVTGNVSGHTDDSIVRLVRKYGRCPIQLGEYDQPV